MNSSVAPGGNGYASLQAEVRVNSTQIATLTGQTNALAAQTNALAAQTNALAEQTKALTAQTAVLAERTEVLTSLTTSLAAQVQDLGIQTTALSARFEATLPFLATKADIQALETKLEKMGNKQLYWLSGVLLTFFLGFSALQYTMMHDINMQMNEIRAQLVKGR